jgi:ABC-type lipoprotein release transport system permease subunit
VAVLSLMLRATLRQRWRSWLLLCLLIALVSGLVLGAAAAGRRTSTSFPRFAAAHGYDAFTYSASPLPKMAALPDVSSVTRVQLPGGGTPICACTRAINLNYFSIFEVSPPGLNQMVKLVAGRMPDQSDPDQVLASFPLQQDAGVHVGTVIRVPLLAASQRSAALSDNGVTPKGPTVAFHVVGIEAAEIDFPSGNTPSYDLFTTQAFARKYSPLTVNFDAYFVRLRHGSADLPQFQSSARTLGGLSVSDLDGAASTIDSSIHPQVVGWWILAGLAALVGLTVVAQALGRQATVETDTFATLSALGVSRRQLVVLTMARTVVIGLVGVAGGMLLAFLLSPLTPVGEARTADPSLGFAFDAPLFLLGALAALVLVGALGVWPAIRTSRIHRRPEGVHVARPSRVVAFLAGAGAPPSALIGVRHALERGRGRSAVPVGSAWLGSILAVTALCATVVFGASLTHLTSTPALYGQPFTVWFSTNGTGSTAQNDHIVASLERGRTMTDITAGISGDVTIDRKSVNALAGQSLRGPLLLTPVSGHLPESADEVTLGTTTMRQVGAHVGSTVRVSSPRPQGGTRTSMFRVVGTAVFPPDFAGAGLGTGAVFTLNGLSGTRCPASPAGDTCATAAVIKTQGAFLVRVTPGPAGRAGLARLAHIYSSDVDYPSSPIDLVNFGQAVNFPLLFGLVLIVFGTATLLHLLVVSVVRRRREAGLLKAIGFVRRQIAWSVSWQTSTVALIGIVVGVPAGIAIGRLIWRVFAESLGVLPVEIVLAWSIIAVAAGTVLVANLLAIGPAFVASRSRPASLLKAE